MAVDPRTFTVKSCPTSQQAQQSTASNKKSFFSELGKVGDLEVLEDIGFGKVGEGLRLLTKTSDSIRTGSVLAGIMGPVETGAKKVLDTVGIDVNAAQDLLDGLNPGVANRAYGQAKVIYDKVKEGNFELEDIPYVFQDLQSLETAIRGIYKGKQNETREFAQCGASPYATDLISWAPKFKFLFVVQFEFTEPYASKFKDIHAAFVVKNSSRPNINFEHEELNMYNFWTKVPKRTVYEPMTMRFYDDNHNQAMTLYNAYLKAMSPIANLPFEQKMEDVSGAFENISMDFNNMNKGGAFPGPAPTHKYASSYGPTAGVDTKNIFKRITLFHVYREGRLMNVYNFFNPKIISMELDDLDMADNGNGSEMSFQFVYDAMHITTGYQVSDTTTYNIESISGGNYGAQYPIKDHDEFDATNDTVSDPRQPPGQEQDVLTGISDAAKSVISNTTGIISNAYDNASNFVGSLFT